MLFVVLDNLITRFLKGRRIEQAITTQVLVVVTNKQLQLCITALGKPGCSAYGRLTRHSRVDYGKNLLDFIHRRTWQRKIYPY
jgi:hypothetical protein